MRTPHGGKIILTKKIDKYKLMNRCFLIIQTIIQLFCIIELIYK